MKKLLLFIALMVAGSGYSQDLCYTPAGSDYKELVLDTYRNLDMSGYRFVLQFTFMFLEEATVPEGKHPLALTKH